MWKKLIFPIAVTLLFGLSACATTRGASDGATEAAEGVCKIITGPMAKVSLLEDLANAINGLCKIPGKVLDGAMEDVDSVKEETDKVVNPPE